MPKPIKLVEGINISYFYNLFESMGNRHRCYHSPGGGLIFTSECTESRKPFGNRSLCNRL